MPNDIVRTENQLWPLRLLLTQNRLYGGAKVIVGLQIFFVVGVPAALLVMQQRSPTLRVWAALYGLAAVLSDFLVLDVLRIGIKHKAAAVQERFDCEVLRLPWSELKAGSKPDPEDILPAADTDERLNAFRDWYARDVADVPEHVGRVICQRNNCWWDSKLRRWYRGVVLGAAGILIAIVAVLAVATNPPLTDVILGYATPTLPIVLWVIREARAQSEAADRADRLKKFGDSLWAKVLKPSITEQEALLASREFQDELFAHRKQSPLVSDWFYQLLKRHFEQRMAVSVAAMVSEFKAQAR